MAEFPAMPLWTDAYLGDTRHLTTFEHGAYLLLLMVAWRSPEGMLPDDDKLLSRYAGCTRAQWARIAPQIRAFFHAENGQLLQSRLNDERNAVRRKRESQAANGRASALKNKERHSTKRPLNGTQASTPIPLPLPFGSNEPIEASKEASASSLLKPEHILEKWNSELAPMLGRPRIRELTAERRQLLKARIAQHPLADFDTVFQNCTCSAFLRGENGRSPLTFDWLFKKTNFQKTLEGNYAN